MKAAKFKKSEKYVYKIKAWFPQRIQVRKIQGKHRGKSKQEEDQELYFGDGWPLRQQ